MQIKIRIISSKESLRKLETSYLGLQRRKTKTAREGQGKRTRNRSKGRAPGQTTHDIRKCVARGAGTRGQERPRGLFQGRRVPVPCRVTTLCTQAQTPTGAVRVAHTRPLQSKPHSKRRTYGARLRRTATCWGRALLPQPRRCSDRAKGANSPVLKSQPSCCPLTWGGGEWGPGGCSRATRGHCCSITRTCPCTALGCSFARKAREELPSPCRSHPPRSVTGDR